MLLQEIRYVLELKMNLLSTNMFDKRNIYSLIRGLFVDGPI